MWEELGHIPIKIAKVNISVNTLNHWIEDRLGFSEAKMPEISHHNVSYKEGDIFRYEILGKNI